MENPIEARKRMVQERIEKSFNDGLNLNDEIEKAAHGVYADNAENRRKNRVGQEYGHAAEQKEPTGKPSGSGEQPSVEDHASNASDKALQRAAADKNAKPEVREAAKKELAQRNNDDDKKSMYNDDGELDMNHPSVKRRFELMDKQYSGGKLSDEEQKELDELHKRSEEDKMSKMSPEKKAEYQKGMADLKKRFDEAHAKPKGETTIHGKGVNYEFVSGIKKGDARKILQEAGFKNDMGSNNIGKVYLSDDGKSVKIDYDNKEGRTKTAEIAISSDKSETLNKLYGEFSKEMTAVFDNDEPGKLDKKTLSKNINAELKNFWDKNDTDNDSSDWREGAYQIYKKYSKNNPMSAEKFDHEFASKYQGASQGKKMSFYFSARESGGDESEAENYANTEYNAFMRHLDDPRMSMTKFEPIPFHKSIINDIEIADVDEAKEILNNIK